MVKGCECVPEPEPEPGQVSAVVRQHGKQSEKGWQVQRDNDPQFVRGNGVEWRCEYFPLGVRVVQRDSPHHYVCVYRSTVPDDAELEMAKRRASITGDSLRDWLNGGLMPGWLDSIRHERIAENGHARVIRFAVVGPDGLTVYADTRRSEVPEKEAHAALINNLFREQLA